jgi:two-component system, chemotaxis family, chemotaxis protein CheY
VSLRCVIVDDSSFIRLSLQKVITRLGHEVVESFGSGQEFLDRIEDLDCDIIFLDIILPEITGIDVLQTLFHIKPNSNVVVLSGLAQNKVISHCLQLGAMDFIIKPFDEDKLRDLFLVLETTLKGASAESLSQLHIGCHLINLYLQEIMAHSTNIIRKLIRTQIESLLESFKNSHEEILYIDPDNLTIKISDNAWGRVSEEEIFKILASIIPELKFELDFIYTEDFVENLFKSAYVTFCARSRIRKKLEELGPEKIGLEEIPTISYDAPYLTTASSFEEYKSSIALCYFISDMMGPQLKIFINNDIVKEEDVYKSAIFYYTMTTQGVGMHYEGLFGPLPVSSSDSNNNQLSALVYSLQLSEESEGNFGMSNNGLIIIFYTPIVDKISTDYNKISFIIKSRLGDLKSKKEVDKAQIAGIRDDIIEYLTD